MPSFPTATPNPHDIQICGFVTPKHKNMVGCFEKKKKSNVCYNCFRHFWLQCYLFVQQPKYYAVRKRIILLTSYMDILWLLCDGYLTILNGAIATAKVKRNSDPLALPLTISRQLEEFFVVYDHWIGLSVSEPFQKWCTTFYRLAASATAPRRSAQKRSGQKRQLQN